MTIVLATGNPHKAAEFRRVLGPLGFEVVSRREAGVKDAPEETGATFAENARLKARAVVSACGLAAVGDDSGLCVDALGGAPGIYSARYAGPEADDAARIDKLLTALHGVPAAGRTAHFVCALCCILPDGREISVQGACEGLITDRPSGTDGFGYDPVFVEKTTRRTFAEMSGADKDALSHRGRALRELAARLRALFPAGAPGRRPAGPGAGPLSSRGRAALRGMANGLPTILQVGKAGVTGRIVRQAGEALDARELIKGRVLESAPFSPREAADALAQALSARVVQVIGSRFVLYRRSRAHPTIHW